MMSFTIRTFGSVLNLIHAYLVFSNLSYYGVCNTITTQKTEQRHEVDGYDCKNDLPTDLCDSIVISNSCYEVNENVRLGDGCMKSCNFCTEQDSSFDNDPDISHLYKSKLVIPVHEDVESSLDKETKGECEDKIPQCSQYVSVCCTMKEAMNVSCPKTCKFCSETPATMPPSAPGIGMGPTTAVPVPTGSTDQDPCDPTNPPSVTVDVPGQTTTTTQSPLSPLPGNPIPENPIG